MSRNAKHNQQPYETQRNVDQRSGGIYIAGGKLHVRGNVAGRDIIVINLPPPTWRILIAFVLAALILAVAIWNTQFPDPGPMTGIFNIAIADFNRVDEQGQSVAWEDGARLSQSIFKNINDGFQDNPNLRRIVQVRHQEGIVRGTLPDERTAFARQIADTLNAHLVIYGSLEKRGDQTVFVPEFHISERIKEIKGAEEIVGSDQLGKPVTSTSSLTGLGGALVLGDALQARSQALTLFTIGLAYLVAGDRSHAIHAFQESAKIKGWEDKDGKEVLYLFLGAAYATSADPEDLAKASEAYEQALHLNPGYARPYIGLGNLYYVEFVRSAQKDLKKLDQALAEYEKARDAPIKPSTAYVDAKVHVSLGNVYLIKAQLVGPDWFPKAETEYLEVVKEYELGDTQVKPIVGQTYLSLGVIQERWTRNLARSAEYYRKAIASTEDNKDLRQLEETQLKIVESALATPTPK